MPANFNLYNVYMVQRKKRSKRSKRTKRSRRQRLERKKSSKRRRTRCLRKKRKRHTVKKRLCKRKAGQPPPLCSFCRDTCGPLRARWGRVPARVKEMCRRCYAICIEDEL